MLRLIILRKIFSALIVILSISLSPVIAADTADDYFHDAKKLYQTADYEGALIQLKNALQVDRTHIESLLLMGKVNLKHGGNAAAEYAFTQALEFGANPQMVMTHLAEAYLRQGKSSSLLDNLSLKGIDSSEAAEIMGYQAIGYLNNKQPDQARKLIESALSSKPDALMPRVAKCHILVGTGQLLDARDLATGLTKEYPTAARAWLSLGLAENALGNHDAAIHAYGRTTELAAYLSLPRLQRVSLLISQDRDDEAFIDLEFLAANYPNDPRAAYLRGVVLERAGKHKAAEEEFRRCTVILSKMTGITVAQNAQLTMQGALSHMRLGEDESARAYLEGYHVLNSDNVLVNRTLASVLLDLKDAYNADPIIDRLIENSPDDVQILALKARAYKLSGMPHKAAEILLRIAILGVGEFDEQTRIALQQIGVGEIEKGQQGLRRAIEKRRLPEKESFDLATAYLIAGRYPEAVVLAAALARLDPDNLKYLNLLGTALMQAGKLEEAQVTLLEAEFHDKKRLATQLNLARVETAQGKFSVARERLTKLLAEHTKNSDIIFQLSRIEQYVGNNEAAIDLSEGALALSPDWLELRIYLIKLYLKAGRADEAIELGRSTVALNETNMEVRFLLGEVLEAIGQAGEARIVYQLISRKTLTDEVLLRRTAEAQIRIGELRDASYTLFKCLNLEPEHIPTRINYIQVQLKIEKYKTAHELSDALVTDYPQEPIAYVLRAESFAGLEQYNEAGEDYLIAHKLDPSNAAYTVAAFRNIVASGKTDKGEALISRALRETPDNIILSLAYIEYLIRERRWSDAETLILQSLEYFPNNPVLLNNMAHILHKQKRAGALEYARRAQMLAPEIAQINDTLGWILVDIGQADVGLNYLQTAASKLPQDPEVRYHLGVAYAQLGRRAESKVELQKAIASETDFENRQEAIELLQSTTDTE